MLHISTIDNGVISTSLVESVQQLLYEYHVRSYLEWVFLLDYRNIILFYIKI